MLAARFERLQQLPGFNAFFERSVNALARQTVGNNRSVRLLSHADAFDKTELARGGVFQINDHLEIGLDDPTRLARLLGSRGLWRRATLLYRLAEDVVERRASGFGQAKERQLLGLVSRLARQFDQAEMEE